MHTKQFDNFQWTLIIPSERLALYHESSHRCTQFQSFERIQIPVNLFEEPMACVRWESSFHHIFKDLSKFIGAFSSAHQTNLVYSLEKLFRTIHLVLFWDMSIRRLQIVRLYTMYSRKAIQRSCPVTFWLPTSWAIYSSRIEPVIRSDGRVKMSLPARLRHRSASLLTIAIL